MQRNIKRLCLFFELQLTLILFQKSAEVVRCAQQSEPLLVVEGDGEPAMPYTLTAPLSLTLNESAPAFFFCPARQYAPAILLWSVPPYSSSNPNFLDLFDADLIAAPIVEARGAR